MTDRSVIDTLEAALSSADPVRRQAALEQVTDLFVGGAGRFSAEQVVLFDRVFLELSRDIEVKARRRLARCLAALDHVPAKTARRLARDPSPAVATPILRNVLELENSDIIAVATEGSEAHLLAISGRPALDETVTGILVDRGGPRVARAVASNESARLSDVCFAKLVSRAETDSILATAVGTRRDIPKHHFVALVRNASAAVRVKLAAADPIFAREIEGTIADIVADIGRETGIVSDDPALAKTEAARLMHPDRSGDVDTAASARARKVDQAAMALSLLGHVPRDVAERALAEDKPDMLMIIAKVGGCSWKSVKSMLQIQAGDHEIDIDDLLRARKDYDQLQLSTAQQVLARYRARLRAETNVQAAHPV
jgi:uncharacterized protein (DUF2336 family)